MGDEKIYEAIDACRQGSADLADPQLRFLADELERDPQLRAVYDRVQRLDQRIAAALAEVPLPEGLAERIFGLLRAAAGESPSTAQSPAALLASERSATNAVPDSLKLFPDVDPAVEPPLASATLAGAAVESAATSIRAGAFSALRDRRGWLVAGAVAAAALLVAFWLRPVGQYGRDDIVEQARALFEVQAASPGKLLKKDFVISPYLAVLPGTHWRSLDNFLGRSGVAYDLRSPAGVRATLFVVKLLAPPRAALIDAESLPKQPKLYNSGTGGLTTAMWQERGKLYVLVVDGDQRAFDQFIPSQPVVASRGRASTTSGLRRAA